MSEEKNVDVCYQFNKDTRSMVEKIDGRHDKEMSEIKKDIKELVDKMINRLPPWVLIYISFLTLLVGGLLTKVAFR